MTTIITTVAALQAMSGGLAGSYELGANIDASDTFTWNGGLGFEPVGDGAAFTGSFDGKGYIISGLFINRPATDYIGLFGYTDGATIQNVQLADVDMTGDEYVGALVGYAESSVVSNCHSSGAVEAADAEAGGLLGMSDTCTVTSCTSSCAVTADATSGGLIGWMSDGSVSLSHATGAVVATTWDGGGCIGWASVWGSAVSISDCYATGNVSGLWSLGGFIGFAENSDTVITRCSASGDVTAGAVNNSGNGGFVGEVGDSAVLSRCCSTGSVTATGTGTTLGHGGFVGWCDDGIISDCYSRGDVTVTGAAGTDNCGGFCGKALGTTDISVSYSTGVPTAIVMGGFTGVHTAGAYTDCYWDTDSSGEADAIGLGAAGGITNKTTAQLQADLQVGMLTTYWSIRLACNDGYPCLITVNATCLLSQAPPADPTIAPKKVSLELIRNLEIMNGGRFFIDASGNARWESRYHRG